MIIYDDKTGFFLNGCEGNKRNKLKFQQAKTYRYIRAYFRLYGVEEGMYKMGMSQEYYEKYLIGGGVDNSFYFVY